MELTMRKHKDIYIIDISGEMDLYNAHKLKELVGKMIERHIQHIILNLGDVEYIDSSGIGTLIYISSVTKKQRIKLLITGIHGSVKKVIELTKLMGFFPIANSLTEAVQKLSVA